MWKQIVLIVLSIHLILLSQCAGQSPLVRGRGLLGKADWQFDAARDVSSITCVNGHYPPNFCTAHNVALNHKTKTFTVYSDSVDMSLADAYLFRMSGEPKKNFPHHCDQTIDEAYLFTFYFYHGHSNYFHLHLDTLFPIYSLLQARRDGDSDASSRPVVMMPVVEKQRMTHIDWDSGAFDEKFLNKYFILILNALAGDEHLILPLDSNLVSSHPEGVTCFKKASFGAPSLRAIISEPSFMPSFVSFMMDRLGVQRGKPTRPLLGIIKRSGRRKILNEDELIRATSVFVDSEMVEFSGMTFKEQVTTVQKYTVLVGINGAGLMNAIYLPEGGVAVQLVPYNATMLNVVEFGKIIAARGPYLVWRNEHSELTEAMPHDVYNSQSNTIVKVEEFVQLIKEALRLGINKELWHNEDSNKTEL